LGNILETPLEKLAGDKKKRAFARNKEKLCAKCLVCRHLDICRGGCMKNRVRFDAEHPTWHGLPARGNTARMAVPPIESRIEDRENYFCESYKQFFDYTVPRFMQIAAGIRDGSIARHTRSAERIRLHIKK
jgi:sulfatase maturation enzyme AslB (radical SAM superfamily)